MPTMPPCSANCASWMASTTLSTIQIHSMTLLSQCAQHVATFLHNAFGGLHLLLEGGVVRAQTIAVRRFGKKHSIPFFDFQPRRSLLGQHEPDRIADLH